MKNVGTSSQATTTTHTPTTPQSGIEYYIKKSWGMPNLTEKEYTSYTRNWDGCMAWSVLGVVSFLTAMVMMVEKIYTLEVRIFQVIVVVLVFMFSILCIIVSCKRLYNLVGNQCFHMDIALPSKLRKDRRRFIKAFGVDPARYSPSHLSEIIKGVINTETDNFKKSGLKRIGEKFTNLSW